MKILSLFDGISIAQQALNELGIKPKYYASEIDSHAIKITLKNYPHTIQLGDVKNIKPEILKMKFDFLIGGSPCQDLSICNNNRKGLDGERSGLFWNYVEILKKNKPKYFILENVNSMTKQSKNTITKTLYNINPIMIDAAAVSAQSRERLFWIGKLNKNEYEKINIPQPENKNIYLKDVLELKPNVSFTVKLKPNCIRANWRGDGIHDNHKRDSVKIGIIGNGAQGDRIYSTAGKSVSLNANSGGSDAKTGLYAVSVSEQVINRKRQPDGSFKRQLEKRKDDKSSALTGNLNRSLILENSIIRKLTPIECERLQSLPDNYTAGISNTQRYKTLGNGFNCAVIKHIFECILLNKTNPQNTLKNWI